MSDRLTEDEKESVQTVLNDFGAAMVETFKLVRAAFEPLIEWCENNIDEIEEFMEKMKEFKDD